MFVEGNDDSDSYSFIEINVNPCDNTDPKCWFYYLEVKASNFNEVYDNLLINFDPSTKAQDSISS